MLKIKRETQRKHKLFKFFLRSVILAFSFAFVTHPSRGQEPVVGRKAAAKYFPGAQDRQIAQEEPAVTSGEQWLSLHLGSFVSSDSYVWGSPREDQVGRANYGVTYQLDEWKGLDRGIRIEFLEYLVQDSRPRQLVFLPMFTFPLGHTRFPAYFGGGLGLGIFFQQLKGESELAFHYQLVAGLRFFDVFGRTGVFMELAMKNHLHILSDGQFNGTALNAGAVFRF